MTREQIRRAADDIEQRRLAAKVEYDAAMIWIRADRAALQMQCKHPHRHTRSVQHDTVTECADCDKEL